MKIDKPIKNIQHTITRLNKLDEHELFLLKKRLDLTIICIIVVIFILVLRLWFLQVYLGLDYEEQSRENRIQKLRIVAPRGTILDRNGTIIVANRPSFNVVWTRETTANREEVFKKLASILGIEVSFLLDRIRDASGTPHYQPLRLKEDIGWDKVVLIENNTLNLPGIRIEVLPARTYPFGNMASHLIGYLSEINKQELQAQNDNDYEGGDKIGKLGVEKLFEHQLRGEMGQAILEVDVRGFEKKRIDVEPPLPGNDIYLTIDAALQKRAESAMADQTGAVVVQEVNTGKILALTSTPPMPLNKFVGGISTDDWNELLNNPLHPLTNKSIQGQYPPASTYKIVTALAGLQEGVITQDTTFYCSGSLPFGNRTYHCWKKSGHGAINLHKALAESCDVYFYQLSQKLDVDTLAKYAGFLGLGSKTGIKLDNEKSGLIPTAEWKVRTYKERWQDGETLSISIGQGFNLATPLQVNQMTSALANGGKVYLPIFLKKITDPEGKTIESFAPVLEHEFNFDPKNLDLVRKGLVAAVNGPHGTGAKARLQSITVAGKTGTAQVVHRSQHLDMKEADIPYQYRDHAWFTCYAPAEKPEIAVTVLVEHGRHGGSTAGPVARKILKEYFKIVDKDQSGDESPYSGD
ncbi:MAG: penicillin-binding protein 2 [Proteobacteria bacterium]|nr:penicillin-binding protein 2 [Pseudomonadota bacterium]MBU1686002.1 penicillin-binding protein 2 [Pseudomonadota bacterium]